MRTLNRRHTFAAFLVPLIICLPSNLPAQNPVGSPGNLEGGIGLLLGFPQREFKQNLTNTGVGAGFDIGYVFRPFPITLGLEGAYMLYGQETRREPFSYTIPDVTVEVTRTNNLLQLHGFFRLQPAFGPVRPYAEWLIGANYFWTETSIRSEWSSDNHEVASSTNQDDAVFSYGGAAGLKVQVYQTITEKNTPLQLFVDLRMRYLLGGKAQYLKEGSVTVSRSSGRVYYDTIESTTDMLTGQLGVSVVF